MASSKMNAAKVRPKALGDEDLGVGDLPQKIIRDAHLARGADQQVGVGHVRRVEMAVNVFFADAVGGDVLELCISAARARKASTISERAP